MPGGEEVIESRRADEVIVDADIRARVGIGKVEVEVDDALGRYFQLFGNQLDQSCVVLAEYFTLFFEFFIE